MEERIKQIAEAISGLKYYEWCKIRHAIEQKYASASNQIVLEDTEAIAGGIRFEVIGYSSTI